MNLKQLEAFVCVADNKSFSKAAKELFLTQPTISAHIASLEKELDARLFVRNTKEVDLSEDGTRLYSYARQMVELEKKVEEEFGKRDEGEQHCIRIAASTVPAQYLLPEILAKFNEKYPKEQFKIQETDSARVVEKIVEQSIDVGFTGTVLEKKHCVYLPFYEDELIIITPNTGKYRALKESDESAVWITGESIIMREEGSGTRKEAEKQLKKKGIAIGDLNIVASIENQETIKRSVENGVGISIISKLAAKKEIDDGELLGFPLLSGDTIRNINIVYNKNAKLARSIEKFVKTAKEVYSK